MPVQKRLPLVSHPHPTAVLEGIEPFYTTEHGAAYLGDSREVLKSVPDRSINLVVTSPPYALHFKKEYGNVSKTDYIRWFMDFAVEIKRVLTDDGSFVLNIGGSYEKGAPVRSIYHYKLLVALVEDLDFTLAQECFWYNPAKMPVPAEWVTVRRIRIRDSTEFVWWFSKTPWPKANNRNVLKPYSKDQIRLNRRGVKETVRPSGHLIRTSFEQVSNGGSIPPNVFEDESAPEDFMKFGNNASNDEFTKRCKQAGIGIHPARFPAAIPEFFIKFLTDETDLVLDPFAGSNTTGAAAERLERGWIAIESLEPYLEASKLRFEDSTPAAKVGLR
ncbi:MAG: site-specific DNA-methyltransferase [Deltaproteobacteria bacterium]|nr:site-specific DNA-methyltransferase [Deltaproteobacteria bacterium]